MKCHILTFSVIWGIYPGVRNNADFKNCIFKRTSKRFGVVLVGFNGNGVLFGTIFIVAP